MSPPNPLSLDGLLRHASGLRALARGLLSDEHAAEDVVQDTWIAALERPPRNQTAVGGWLRQVARRLALKRQRGEGRRTEREERVSRAEALASVDELAEQREVLRSVVNAVLDLEEPYQSVVVMRFYQDLAPRDIARKLGVPVATVKSQLHRAQEQLRCRLDADAGGARGQWALALASVTNWHPVPLVPIIKEGASPGAGSSVIKGLTMEWKMALAAATLVTAVLTVRELTPAAEIASPNDAEVVLGDPAAPLQAAEPPADEPAAGVALAAQSGGSRKRVAVEETVAQPATKLVSSMPWPEFEFTLGVVIVDENDRPVVGREISLGPRLAPLTTWGTTDGEGRFTATWRAHTSTMELALGVSDSAGRTGMLMLDLDADRPAKLRLALRSEGSPTIRGHVAMHRQTDELRRIEEAAMVGVLRSRQHAGHRVQLGNVHLPTEVSIDLPPGREHPGPGQVFRWPASRLHTGFTTAHVARLRLVADRIVLDGVVLRGVEADLRQVVEVALIEESVGEGSTVLVSGVIRDAAGRPVSLPIQLRRRDGSRTLISELIVGPDPADEPGAFRLRLPRGQVELLVGGGDRGQAVLALDLTGADAPGEVRWNPTLDRGEEVIGRLLDAEGQPLSDWIVEFVVDDIGAPWHDTTVTRADGTFAIPNVPASAGRLIFRRRAVGIPVRQQVAVWPGPGRHDVSLTADELGYGLMRLKIVAPDGEAVQDAEARLWHPDSSRGLQLSSADLARGVDYLPAGHYRAVVGSVENGFVDLGGVDIYAGQPTDLGTVTLPEPGRVTWTGGVEQAKLGWTLVRRGREVDLLVAQGGPADTLEVDISAGEYGLILAGDDLVAPMIPLTVLPGRTTVSEASLEGLRELTLSFEMPEDAAGAVSFSIVDVAVKKTLYASQLASGADGRLFLPEGEYVLRARCADASVETTFAISGMDEALSVSLR